MSEVERVVLEPGMVIFCRNRFHGVLSKYVITRVTRTQAIVELKSGKIRFDREVSGSMFHPRGSGGVWNIPYYQLSTPELEAEYVRQRAIKRVTDTDWKLVSTEDIIKILNILKGREDNAQG